MVVGFVVFLIVKKFGARLRVAFWQMMDFVRDLARPVTPPVQLLSVRPLPDAEHVVWPCVAVVNETEPVWNWNPFVDVPIERAAEPFIGVRDGDVSSVDSFHTV